LADDDQMGADRNGIIFRGDKGVIMCPGWGGAPRLLPDAAMDAFTKPAKTLPRSKGHHRDWLEACKGGPPASANFEYGARITELVLLGNVSLRTRKKLHWDPVAMKATNAPAADKFIREEYRAGWELPGVS
jgi:hypothetical protein